MDNSHSRARDLAAISSSAAHYLMVAASARHQARWHRVAARVADNCTDQSYFARMARAAVSDARWAIYAAQVCASPLDVLEAAEQRLESAAFLDNAFTLEDLLGEV